ncbi:MAG: PAS domain-containing sensor histidine kinase [Anaerolineae bacterium]|nr:PAS domain-containing sensor histidine kinase [Anaerolineae bacterium]
MNFTDSTGDFDFLMGIADQLSEAILIISHKGAIVFANARVSEMFGYPVEALIGQPIEYLVPGDFRSLHERHRKRYMENPHARPMGSEDLELEGYTRDGETIPLEISLSPVKVQNDLYIVAFITNVTSRKHAQAQMLKTEKLRVELAKEREYLELKEQFLSITSHEFRKPLTAILSSVGIVERYFERLSPEDYLTRIKEVGSQAQHMYHMLEDLLTITRMQAGGFRFLPRPLDLFKLCESLVVQPEGEKPRIQTTWQKPIHNVVMDQKLLHHILENLLSNAVKYAPNTEKVEFNIASEGSDVIFQIRDNGIGIPIKDQERIYEAFYRGTNTHRFDGTGLGMMVVKLCVELHRGTIDLESVPDEGTTVTVRLPMFALAQD